MLDATFKGYYSTETMEIVNRLVSINNGTLELLDEDFDVLKQAALLNDYMGMNYYQSRFIQHYEGENDIHHNGQERRELLDSV